MRNPGSRICRVATLLGCLAMLPHMVVPVGYMLDRDPQSGGLSYLLCPSQGPVPAPTHPDAPDPHAHHGGHGSHHDGHDPGAPAQPDPASGGDCAFSLAFAPLAAAPPAAAGVDDISSNERPRGSSYAITSGSAWSSQRARAPPGHS